MLDYKLGECIAERMLVVGGALEEVEVWLRSIVVYRPVECRV